VSDSGQALADKLQAELAFQGQAIDALNAALGAQQQDLLLLKRQLALLVEELRTLRERGAGPTDASDADEAPPPHY
jgi:SlyX protein